MIQAVHLFSVIIIVIISYFISILIEPLLPVIYFICRWLLIFKLTEWIHSYIIGYTRQLWNGPQSDEENDNNPNETIFSPPANCSLPERPTAPTVSTPATYK